MWFEFGRFEGFPTQYPENKTPVTVDTVDAGLILAFAILLFCFYLILPGFSRKSQIYIFIRVSFSLVIGIILLIGNFGQEWEVGSIKSKMPYRVGTKHEINATVGIKLGLRSVNVTLYANTHKSPLKNERVDYNERFSWTWDQGRLGFGPFAGHLQQEFRKAQREGVPLPILWVVDYFVVDGEGLRFGRFYRTAGWYSHILMWAGFSTWILANILFFSVIRYGAKMLILTGIFQLLANLIWTVVRNPFPLEIPFEHGILKTHYGSNFWVTFVSGLICMITGIVIFICDARFSNETVIFFGLDPLSEYEEIQITQNELNSMQNDHLSNNFEMDDMENFYADTGPAVVNVLRRRSTMQIGKKARLRPFDEQVEYGNTTNSSDISLPQSNAPPVFRNLKKRMN